MTYTPHPLRHRRRKFTERLPPNTRDVSRASRFGNPFRIVRVGNTKEGPTWAIAYQVNDDSPDRVIRDGLTREQAQAEAVEQYREWLKHAARGIEVLAQARQMLRGKRLACYCPLDQPCHADVLAELVNGPDAGWGAAG